VNPAAEDVVIGAAYRALIRHYHPDTNPDPMAKARAREITAAYAVLRDPAKRAEYDAQRAAGDLWPQDEDEEVPRQPPPAMRTVGIAAAALALALVAIAWNNRPIQPASHTQAAKVEPARSAPNPAYPIIQLEPESERLARLREEAEILSPTPVAPPPEESVPADPILVPPNPRSMAAAPALASRRTAVPAGHRPAPPSAPKAKAVPATPKSKQLIALETMAAGFFTQSMAHATDAKKELLLGARNRSATKRKACGSDACVADAYVRQIRETSAIMEGRAGPPK